MQQVLKNPIVTLAIGIVLAVWGAQMTSTRTANTALVLAWVLFAWFMFTSRWKGPKRTRRRVAFQTTLCLVIGSLMYALLWKLPTPPLAITQIVVEPPPYSAGQSLRIRLELTNTQPGLRLRGSNRTFVGSADEQAFTPAKRSKNEQSIWRLYEEGAHTRVPIRLATIAGLMTVPLDGPILTASDARALNAAAGVVYVAGQIDYGTGSLDYCGYVRPVAEPGSTACIEHNGPSSRVAFNR